MAAFGMLLRDSKYKGTASFALVREVATHHGGTARYRPREGGGSVFEVELPVA